MTNRSYPGIRQSIEQRQIMTFALHQALQILQMPQLELAERIMTEIEMNPVLELTDSPRYASQNRTMDPLIAAAATLRDHLIRQAREMFSNSDDYQIAKYLIDQLDESGWITFPIEEMPFDRESILRVLLIVQTFDPPGICARHLQESLWLQLRSQTYSLAEVLVRDHFEDLLQGRLALIQKRLNVAHADLQKALHQLAQLSFRPASKFDLIANHTVVPDLSIREIDTGWLLEVGTQELPAVQIRDDYVDLIPQLNNKEEKRQLRGWITSAKWLQRCLRRRRDTLSSIGRLLIRTQHAFFSHASNIRPIEIQKVAELLNVHVSTAWRAVAGKTLACPRGMIALRQFFSESAAHPIKKLLQSMVETEDKSQPLTDEEIMIKLQEKGIHCARRTVAKYRRALQINTAARRKVMP
ncbi:MAG: rpoN [Parachlamydiales bacterium]|nr:rpoN [Parachlamydiales bacterium]